MPEFHLDNWQQTASGSFQNNPQRFGHKVVSRNVRYVLIPGVMNKNHVGLLLLKHGTQNANLLRPFLRVFAPAVQMNVVKSPGRIRNDETETQRSARRL